MTLRACLGICCPSHHLCAHYAAVERLSGTEQAAASCETWDHRFPRFELIPTTTPALVGIDSEGGSHD